MLNYLLRRPNSTPYVFLNPLDLRRFGEPRVLRAFARRPPDWITIVQQDTSDFGYRYFGYDYGLRIRQWIEANYTEVAARNPELAKTRRITFWKKSRKE